MDDSKAENNKAIVLEAFETLLIRETMRQRSVSGLPTTFSTARTLSRAARVSST